MTNARFDLIGLTGPARCGKDTVASTFLNELGYQRLSFAGPIRNFVAEILGIDREGLETFKEQTIPGLGAAPELAPISARYMMQTAGTQWGRDMIDPNLWVWSAHRRWKAAGCPRAIVTDVRFENEAAFIRKYGRLVHVHRPGQERIAESSHASEAGVRRLPEDMCFANLGTLEDVREGVLGVFG